jgi:GNAT superfamily N-acetyltransferase
MDKKGLLALYDQELRIEIEIPGVQKEATPDLVRIVRPAPGMNYILYSRLGEAEVDAVIQEQIAFFSQMEQPFSWHVYDHDWPPDLKDRLVSHGFIADDDPDAVMVLELGDALSELLEPVAKDVRRITQQDQLEDIAQIEAQVYGSDFTWLKGRLSSHLEVPGYLSLYVAYVEEQPVSTGWIHFHPKSQFASLFGGATLSEYRQRGLYTAVLAARAQEAIRRGYRFLSTGASQMSQPILTRNGFRLLTYAHAYEWGGNPENLRRDGDSGP